VTIFALLRAHMDKEGKGKISPWTSENNELSLASLHRARTTVIFCAFFPFCFIYTRLSLTELSASKVNFFWVSISLFLKNWLQRADQNRGQVDNQSRISRKALACFKVFHLGACWGQRQH